MLTSDYFKEQVVFTDKDDNGIILSSSKLINLKYGYFFNKVMDFKVKKSFGHKLSSCLYRPK